MKRLLSVGVLALGLPLACGGVASSEQTEPDSGGPGGSTAVGSGGSTGSSTSASTGSGGTSAQGGSAGSGGTSAQGGSAGSGGSGQGGSGQGGAGAGGGAGHGGSAGSGGFAGRDGGGGSAGSGGDAGTVDPRCPKRAPASGSTCNASALTCSYNYYNGCLCTPLGLYNCPQVELTCPANMSGSLIARPWPPDGGAQDIGYFDSGSGAAPAPQARTCSCSGTNWSCLPN